MKYRTVSLNDREDYLYGLVKYNDQYKNYLEELRKMNKDLADSVMQYPKIYNESSDHQSYMIISGCDRFVGAIKIGTSTNEKDLEIEVQLNEEFFKSQEHIISLIDQLVESLKLYFYDKENIEINLINDIDLSKIDSSKYRKNVYDENLTTYICTNKTNNILIPRLIEEINGTEKCLVDWKQSWWQKFDDYELDSEFDEELLEEVNRGDISLPEMFTKVKKMSWIDINSTKSSRSISFSRNGKIEFLKKPHYHKNGSEYKFTYNILNDGFNLKTKNNESEFLEIDENPYFTNIKTNKLNILNSKDDKRKKITYFGPVIDKSSTIVEMWTNEQNEIENCYIDFRTHKSNGKINGLYALRITPQKYYSRISIRFISRKGNRFVDFSDEISNDDEELFSTIVNGKVTIELIDELVRRVIPIINKKATNYKKQSLSTMNETIITNLTDSEEQAINFVKQIVDEIPLPHLQNNLKKFVSEQSKKNKVDKKRVLK